MDNSSKKKPGDSSKEENHVEKEWDNPKNPEATEDERDTEQILRQLEEAKRRQDNLTEEDKN
jgi:hypothetical protein